MKRTTRQFFMFGIGLALILNACSIPGSQPAVATAENSTQALSSPAPIAEPKAGGTLVISYGVGTPRHFNPALISGTATAVVGAQLFASPLRYDGNWNPQPYLAESWEISEDGLSVTLHLVHGATFHDGVMITSEDVAFSVMTVKQYHPFRTMFAPVETVETPDPYTAVIRLSQPHPAILLAMSPFLLPILPKHVYGDGQDLLTHPANLAPVGSGPFKFISFAPNKSIVLERYDDFFIPGRPYLDQVIFRLETSDPAAQMVSLMRQETHMTLSYSDFTGLDLISRDENLIETQQGNEGLGAINWLAFNLLRPPLDNKSVRQAIAYAVDPDFIIQYLHEGRSARATGPIFPNSPFYEPDVSLYEVDLEKANRLLDEAGFPRLADDTRFSLTLDYLPALPNQQHDVALYIKHQLEELGIEVTVRTSATFPEWAERIGNWDFDMTMDIVNNWGDPVVGVHRTYICANIRQGQVWTNTQNYCNPEVDALLAQAAREMDQEKRLGLYSQFQKIVTEELPILWLNEVPTYNIYNAGFGNPPLSIWGMHAPLDEVYWAKEPDRHYFPVPILDGTESKVKQTGVRAMALIQQLGFYDALDVFNDPQQGFLDTQSSGLHILGFTREGFVFVDNSGQTKPGMDISTILDLAGNSLMTIFLDATQTDGGADFISEGVWPNPVTGKVTPMTGWCGSLSDTDVICALSWSAEEGRQRMRNFLSRPFLFILHDASIRIKVLIAPAILILTLVFISGMAMYGLNTQAKALEQVNDITLDRITQISEFALKSEQVQSDIYNIAVLRYMELPEEEIWMVESRLSQGVSDMKIMYGKIATTWPLDDTERAILAEMESPMDDFIRQGEQAVEVVGDNPSFGVLMIRSSTLKFTEFSRYLAELRDYQYDKISRTQTQTAKNTETLVRMIVGFVFFMTAAGILTNLYTSDQLITRPIQATTQLMSRLADNDLQIEVPGVGRKDEIGAMARAVEVFRANAVEKARLDEELQESQERLLTAQAVAHVGNWELDLASKTIWASEEAFRIYGLERVSPYLPLEQAQKIPVSEDRPRLDTALNALLQNNSPYDEEFYIRRPNEDSARVIHSIANLVCDNNGKPLKVVGVIQDVTDRAQAEAALRQSEEKFAKAFHTSSYAITITHVEDGRHVEVNEAFIAITGFTREEALASSSLKLNLWGNPKDREQVVDALRKGQSIVGQEYLFRRKNNEIFTGLLSAQTIQLSQGQCILSSINDITERKRGEEKLQMFSNELERSNKELEQFAYIASHDLQEPLRMVTSYLGLIESRYSDKLDSDAIDFIKYAVDGAQRMKSLITALLDYSRIGTHGRGFTVTNCETVLMNSVINLQVSIEESLATITHDPLPRVMGDEVQLGSLFQNLIGNAIKFRSKKPLQVHISVQQQDENWIFSVQDNGIGIEPQHFERIFQIFQRAHNREEYPGTGIGLAICKRIVERHGGRIWIESEPGESSTFFFTLPSLTKE